MRKTRKPITVAMCALVLALGVNATYAYLTDSASVANTFTVGNVGIVLTESADLDLKMVPGEYIEKDPVVTVDEGSESCWLFVEVDEAGMQGVASQKPFILWDVDAAEGWTKLGGADNVWYREYDASAQDREFYVLAENKVRVNPETTKGDMDALLKDGAAQPTLTFTAYAVQKAGFEAADYDNDESAAVAAAWAVAKPAQQG